MVYRQVSVFLFYYPMCVCCFVFSSLYLVFFCPFFSLCPVLHRLLLSFIYILYPPINLFLLSFSSFLMSLFLYFCSHHFLLFSTSLLFSSSLLSSLLLSSSSFLLSFVSSHFIYSFLFFFSSPLFFSPLFSSLLTSSFPLLPQFLVLLMPSLSLKH